jgi:hypothetical protein
MDITDEGVTITIDPEVLDQLVQEKSRLAISATPCRKAKWNDTEVTAEITHLFFDSYGHITALIGLAREDQRAWVVSQYRNGHNPAWRLKEMVHGAGRAPLRSAAAMLFLRHQDV